MTTRTAGETARKRSPVARLLGAIAALLVLCSCSSPADPAEPSTTDVGGTPAATADVSFGVQQDSHYDFQKIEPMVERMRSMGLKWLRLQMLWENIEPDSPGTFNWPQYDLLFDKLRGSGIQVIAVLNGAPKWATKPDCRGDNGCPPADLQQYAKFAQAVVQRYGADVRAWEIWNEPNQQYAWNPSPDAQDYVALLRTAYSAVKQVAPGETVISAGLSPTGTLPGSFIAPVEFLEQMYRYGARGSFDAVGWHPYTPVADFGITEADNAWTQMSETPISARSVMESNGDAGKKIWATEFGVSTISGEASDDLQADTLSRAVRLWATYDFAGPLIIFNYRDRNVALDDPNSHYGIVRYDDTPKPAVPALTKALAEVR